MNKTEKNPKHQGLHAKPSSPVQANQFDKGASIMNAKNLLKNLKEAATLAWMTVKAPGMHYTMSRKYNSMRESFIKTVVARGLPERFASEASKDMSFRELVQGMSHHREALHA